MAPPAARDLTSNTEGKQKQTTKVDINQLRSSPPLKILVGNHYFPILKILGGGGEKPLPEPVEKQILMLLNLRMLPHKETIILGVLGEFQRGHPLPPTASTLGKNLKDGTAAYQHNASPWAR